MARLTCHLPSTYRCIARWDWMHCETTVDVAGNWQKSWRALERSYCEGKVMNIGVSNFHLNLLETLKQISNISPSVVQNFETIGDMDMEVREWCSANQVVFMPYASLRNLDSINMEISDKIEDLANKYEVSRQAIVSKFMMQTQAAIIPRSSHPGHMYELSNLPKWSLTAVEMAELGWGNASPRNDL